MNEQIDKLAYTAGMYCDGTPDSWDSETIEKFGLAIVSDILQMVEGHQKRWAENFYNRDIGVNLAPGAEWIANDIKSRYGIK
jgi:hypothetical protein